MTNINNSYKTQDQRTLDKSQSTGIPDSNFDATNYKQYNHGWSASPSPALVSSPVKWAHEGIFPPKTYYEVQGDSPHLESTQ